MSFFVNRFLKGKWFAKSNSLLSNKSKVLSILATLHSYMKNRGMLNVRKDLMLLADYISDIVHGRYKGYNATAIVMALAGVIYVISPLDVVPDFLPFGFLDDVSIITWIISKLSSELSKYEQWKNRLTHLPQGNDVIEEVDYEEV